MTDHDRCKSFLGKLFDNVRKSDWNIWNLSENKPPSACPSKRKKMEEEEERAKARQRSTVGSEGGDSVESDRAGSESGSGEFGDFSEGSKSPYAAPSQICPSTSTKPSCCYIKLQDPCAPCCCEKKKKLPPCPPKYGPQEPREPICGCDLCQKNPNNDKCCDRNKAFRGISLDARYFEKA